MFNPIPKDKLYTLPNRNSSEMTILNLIKMAKIYSKRVENTVGKGEIAHCEQFLLLPLCFQKTCTAGT